MKIERDAAHFVLGGTAYVGLELLYRGRSHISMFGAGGLCYLLIGKIRKLPLSIPAKLGAGAGIITAVELGTGLLVNRDHQVWDYRQQWGNFKGQICPLFMALWIPAAMAAMELYEVTDAGLDKLIDLRREQSDNSDSRRRFFTPSLLSIWYNVLNLALPKYYGG